MRVVLPEPVITQLAGAPSDVQRAFWKQLRFLLRDLRHPSLDAKKYPESGDPAPSKEACLPKPGEGRRDDGRQVAPSSIF